MGRISMPQGKGSQLHNRREYEKIGKCIPDNIDVSKTSENINLVDKDIKQAYQEIFGEALEKYNRKQKRADRQISDYYEHIKKSKNGEKLFYEDVVQWGDKDDFQNPQTREKAKEALVQYVKSFEKRNTNLRLIGAYIHMDEASPHLHLDYIPVAHGYSRGLETRNSLDKAMKQMGFQPEKESRKNNATKLWKDNERMVFGEICRDLGLEVEAERKARGSLSVEEYKDARDKMIGEIEKEHQAILAETDLLQDFESKLENAVLDHLDNYEEERERWEIALDNVQKELDSLNTQKSGLEFQIKTLTAKKDYLRAQRNELATEKGRLEAQTEPLKQEYEAILSEIKPLQDLKASIDEIADGKTVIPGFITLKKNDFEVIKEQAKSYAANRDEIISLREREINISQKENKLDQREKEIEQHFVQRKLEFNRDVTQRKAKQRKLEGELYVQKADLEKKQNHLDCLINRQPHLNELLSQAEEENKKKDKQIKELKNENCSLRSENFDLKRQISALKEQIKKIKTEVHEKIKRAYQSLTSVVKAVRTLKYDKTGDYKIKELSQKQEYLIDGVADYSAKLAKEEDFPELAKDIENYYGIDKGIQNFVEPPAKKRSRDYDRER